ncbi:MAG: CDP-glucose 4,6-dehydratase [Hyphomicrobiaceae bacterium]|nr:CDP-glucose 4,6-dehydratase [Hyphomicrobiaceae bacterium]
MIDMSNSERASGAMITPSYWGGKRVLVTGHTGFKGAWVSLVLSGIGARVTGLSLAAEEPSLYAMARIAEACSASHIADLRDLDGVKRIVRAADPQIVLHLAAQSLVRRAYRDPVATFGSNVMGTVHLLEALREASSLESVLVTTTDKVYFNAETGAPFREGDRLGGTEPYGTSKAAAEHVVAAYRASYFAPRGVPVVVARAGNVIGGGDWSEDRILPDIARAGLAGRTLDVRNPKAVRPWQHVLDAIEGYLLLAEASARGGPQGDDPEAHAWNFGPATASDMITVEEICRIAERLWPGRFAWRHVPDPAGIKESGLLLLDPTRAMSTLGWRPRWDAPTALAVTLDWYRAVAAGEDAEAATAADIAAHGIGTAA